MAETNINRQLVALHSTVGRPKAEVLAERLRDINPDLQLTVIEKYIRDEETDRLLDAAPYDYAVDAIDTLSPKLALIKGCLDRGIPLVSSMGAGAKTDPTRMEEQNKKSNVGTISYLPALFGIGCASVVVRDLLGEMEDSGKRESND